MTKMQKKIVERIRAYVLEHDCFGPEYEVKRFDVKEIELGLVRIYSITGWKNDENSIIRFTSRKRRKIIIGPKGGIAAYPLVKNKEKVFRGWSKAMFLGYDTHAHDFPSDD